MIYRIIILSAQFLILLILLSLIFTNPFLVSFDIGNYKYSFSSNVFAGVSFICLILIYLFLYILFRSRLSLNNYFLKNKYKKLEKGHFYFVEAMIALANKDNRSASKFYKKMNSFIKDDLSLSLLLKSEVLKIERNYSELSQVYETMIKSKKTEALGYRGLMEQNLNNLDYHHAFLYGEKLFDLNPNIDSLYKTLIFIVAKTRNWNQLILLSEKAFSKKIIDKNTANENKSIGYYEIAKIKSNSDIKDSIYNINKAINLKKNFSPYIKLHLELLAKSNNISLLKKMIKKYWQLNPNPLIRSTISQIIIESKLGDLSFINQIVKNNFNENESKKLLIFFAIKNQEWSLARKHIIGLIGSNPSKEICLFMADIELGENNDKQKSDSWIKRSENFTDENAWYCKITNQSQEEWSSLSNSGYFNSLVLNNKKMIEN